MKNFMIVVAFLAVAPITAFVFSVRTGFQNAYATSYVTEQWVPKNADVQIGIDLEKATEDFLKLNTGVEQPERTYHVEVTLDDYKKRLDRGQPHLVCVYPEYGHVFYLTCQGTVVCKTQREIMNQPKFVKIFGWRYDNNGKFEWTIGNIDYFACAINAIRLGFKLDMIALVLCAIVIFLFDTDL